MTDKLHLYKTDNTYPYKNLAVEEYFTKTVAPKTVILYLWQNRRTVVIGRNQNSFKECNVKALKEDGGFLVRRLSGGGAVFHDLGNLNFTFCVRYEDYDVAKQTEVILRAAKLLGINAERTGRNDIAVEGRKFSGNAFWRTGNQCYHHGTILIDTDGAAMQKYLNPDTEKLKAKGVSSVRSRVCNLIEYAPDISVEKMAQALETAFGEVYAGEVNVMSTDELTDESIDEATERFAADEWIFGKNHEFDHSFGKRFDWGDIRIELCVKGNIIEEARIWSDAMDQDIVQEFAGALVGCKYDSVEMAEAIGGVQESESLSGVDVVRMRDDVRNFLAEIS